MCLQETMHLANNYSYTLPYLLFPPFQCDIQKRKMGENAVFQQRFELYSYTYCSAAKVEMSHAYITNYVSPKNQVQMPRNTMLKKCRFHIAAVYSCIFATFPASMYNSKISWEYFKCTLYSTHCLPYMLHRLTNNFLANKMILMQ